MRPSGCVAAAVARHDTVPTTATLSWQHVPQYASYEIRRSPRPYFAWDDADADPRGTVPAPPAGTDVVRFDDENAIGDPAVNAYYLVRGVNAAGAAGESNRVGEFDFSLAPGSPEAAAFGTLGALVARSVSER